MAALGTSVLFYLCYHRFHVNKQKWMSKWWIFRLFFLQSFSSWETKYNLNIRTTDRQTIWMVNWLDFCFECNNRVNAHFGVQNNQMREYKYFRVLRYKIKFQLLTLLVFRDIFPYQIQSKLVCALQTNKHTKSIRCDVHSHWRHRLRIISHWH